MSYKDLSFVLKGRCNIIIFELHRTIETGDLQTIGIANAKHRKAILAAIENLKTGGNGILSSPQNPTAELQPTKGRRGAGKPKRKVKKR